MSGLSFVFGQLLAERSTGLAILVGVLILAGDVAWMYGSYHNPPPPHIPLPCAPKPWGFPDIIPFQPNITRIVETCDTTPFWDELATFLPANEVVVDHLAHFQHQDLWAFNGAITTKLHFALRSAELMSVPEISKQMTNITEKAAEMRNALVFLSKQAKELVLDLLTLMDHLIEHSDEAARSMGDGEFDKARVTAYAYYGQLDTVTTNLTIFYYNFQMINEVVYVPLRQEIEVLKNSVSAYKAAVEVELNALRNERPHGAVLRKTHTLEATYRGIRISFADDLIAELELAAGAMDGFQLKVLNTIEWLWKLGEHQLIVTDSVERVRFLQGYCPNSTRKLPRATLLHFQTIFQVKNAALRTRQTLFEAICPEYLKKMLTH